MDEFNHDRAYILALMSSSLLAALGIVAIAAPDPASSSDDNVVVEVVGHEPGNDEASNGNAEQIRDAHSDDNLNENTKQTESSQQSDTQQQEELARQQQLQEQQRQQQLLEQQRQQALQEQQRIQEEQERKRQEEERERQEREERERQQAEAEQNANLSPEWVGYLEAASLSRKIVVVESFPGTSEAMISAHQFEDDGKWHRVIGGARAYTGSAGIGAPVEDVPSTPGGTYLLGLTMGTAENPGSTREYTHLTPDHWWVSDPNSPLYDTLVDLSTTPDAVFDRSRAEHLSEMGGAYELAIEIQANPAHVPGGGSAYFIHCATGESSTEGCVATDRDTVASIMRWMGEGTLVAIGTGADLRAPWQAATGT